VWEGGFEEQWWGNASGPLSSLDQLGAAMRPNPVVSSI